MNVFRIKPDTNSLHINSCDEEKFKPFLMHFNGYSLKDDWKQQEFYIGKWGQVILREK